MQQPVVEATGVQFADAALQFAQMALLDLAKSQTYENPGFSQRLKSKDLFVVFLVILTSGYGLKVDILNLHLSCQVNTVLFKIYKPS